MALLVQWSSPFLFTLCQVGAEPTLKSEITRYAPHFHFAFSRPGFLTFKSTQGDLQTHCEIDSIFARMRGVSLGKVTLDGSSFFEIATEAVQTFGKSKLRLHVFERDRYAPGDSPKGFKPGEWAEKAKTQISSQISNQNIFYEDERAAVGDLVINIMLIEENEAWLGYHVHSDKYCPYPGGKWPITMPQDSPSRAYLKLEEVLAWSNLPLKVGDIAVECGSAPGGASLALLNRGLEVVGIDPAEMDPLFQTQSKFRHIQREVGGVLREDLPNRVDWLLSDMNISPQVSLASVDRLGTRMMDSLLGMILTLKLNQWKVAQEIPPWIAHVKAMGLKRIRVAQLSTHGQEVALVGLTAKGVRRLTAMGR